MKTNPNDDPAFTALENAVAALQSEKKKQPKTRAFVLKKPILNKSVEEALVAAGVQYMFMDKWKEWGMDVLRRQGSCILLWGPPGCGKTVSAEWLAFQVKRPLARLDLGSFGSITPGENERRIEAFFADGEKQRKTLFLDECDSIIWDRASAGGMSQWMVSVINKLLTSIGNYKHLVILATNRREALDPALQSRLIADIHIPRPEYAERKRLWESKVPKKFPLKLTAIQWDTLANYNLAGREIENALMTEAQYAILQKREPQFDSLCNVATRIANSVPTHQS